MLCKYVVILPIDSAFLFLFYRIPVNACVHLGECCCEGFAELQKADGERMSIGGLCLRHSRVNSPQGVQLQLPNSVGFC